MEETEREKELARRLDNLVKALRDYLDYGEQIKRENQKEYDHGKAEESCCA